MRLCGYVAGWVLSLVVGPVALFAGGQAEDPIADARRLIADRQYNEAILILSDVVKTDPERIFEAESLLNIIREIRGDYNDLFELLLDTLVNEPGNYPKALSIIERMEAIDRSPNPRTTRQVAQARVTAKLQVDRLARDAIMAEARERLVAGDTAAALRIYLTGFELQQAEFDERGYSPIFLNTVRSAIATIEATTIQAADTWEGFAAAADTFVERLATVGSSTDVTNAFAGIEPQYRELAALADELDAALRVLQIQRSLIGLQFPDDPDDEHLRFLSEFVQGSRDVAGGTEGIAVLVRAYQVAIRDRTTAALAAAAAQRLAVTETIIEQRRWQDLTAAAREFDAVVHLQTQHAVLVADPAAAADRWTIPQVEQIRTAPSELATLVAAVPLAEPTAGELVSNAVDMRRLALAQTLVATLRAADVAFDRYPDLERANAGVLTAEVEQLRSRQTVLADVAEPWAGEIAAYAASTAATAARSRGRVFLELLRSEIDRHVRQDIEFSDAVAGIAYEPLRARVDATIEQLSTADGLVEGVEEAIAPGSAVTVVYRYPDRALALVATTETALQAVSADIAAQTAAIESEPPAILSSAPLQQRLVDLEQLRRRAEVTADALADVADRARRNSATAAQLRTDGNQLFSQTLAAANAFEVDRAVQLVSELRIVYFDSLELQQDAAFRVVADQRIAEIEASISVARNELVTRRVRELLVQARSFYDRAEFNQALAVLRDAEQTFAATNIDENPEIVYLKRLVQAAGNLEQGRFLTETDPAYLPLNSYLNLARVDFQQAQRALRAGDPATADSFMNRARDNLSNVLLVKPFNWDARILQIRIIEIQESENFPVVFQRLVEDALSRRATENPLDILTQLQVLAEINPNYTGLANAIRDLEIQIGIRENPVTQARLARANDLVRRAAAVVGPNSGREQLAAALDLLQEALSINPGNAEAQRLTDSIRIRIGSQATAVLTSTDEQVYRRAEALFLDGSLSEAYFLVQQLLQTTRNQAYPPLVNLRQRIEQRL